MWIISLKECRTLKTAVFKKLKSDKGASIMVALLLFLVCAAVGAVILAAATASSGRMSQLSEMDQRYYSVSSAAELLAKKLCGPEVRIERSKKTTTVSTLSISGLTVTSDTQPAVTTYTTTVNGNPLSNTTDGLSFLSTRAVLLLYGGNLSASGGNSALNTDAAMNYTFSSADESGGDFSIKHGSTHSDLDVKDIHWTMKSDGTLEFKISSDGDQNNKYTVVLTLLPEIDEQSVTLDSEPETKQETVGGVTKTTTTKETVTTKTSTIKWKVGGIRKEVS